MLGRSDSRNKNSTQNKRFGLSSTERLNRQVVKAVFARGKRFPCEQITIIYLRSRHQGAGFVASRKTGKAVKRNMVRRRLREAYRMNKGIFKGLQVIFYTRHQVTRRKIMDCIEAFKEYK